MQFNGLQYQYSVYNHLFCVVPKHHHHSQGRPRVHEILTSHPQSPQALTTANLSVATDLSVLDISYSWNQYMAFCVWLLSVTSVVKVHSCSFLCCTLGPYS